MMLIMMWQRSWERQVKKVGIIHERKGKKDMPITSDGSGSYKNCLHMFVEVLGMADTFW